MGTKRIVDVELWNDEKIELYTPEEKYFWLFLLTNPHSNQLGIYHITLKQMAFYTGYEIETCKKLIERFEKEHKTIKYVDNELAIKNYLNYSVITGGKPVEELLRKCIKTIKNKSLINWVFGQLNIKELNNSVISIINDYKNENEIQNENYVSYSDTPHESHNDTRKRFQKPTIEELKAYIKEKGYSIDPEYFYNYYESKGWLVGKTPMKNWKAAVSNWAKNNYNKPYKKGSGAQLPDYSKLENTIQVSEEEIKEALARRKRVNQ